VPVSLQIWCRALLQLFDQDCTTSTKNWTLKICFIINNVDKNCGILLKFRMMVQYRFLEAAEWLKSTFLSNQDGIVAHIVQKLELFYFISQSAQWSQPKVYQMLDLKLNLKNLFRHFASSSPTFTGGQKVPQFLTPVAFVALVSKQHI